MGRTTVGVIGLGDIGRGVADAVVPGRAQPRGL